MLQPAAIVFEDIPEEPAAAFTHIRVGRVKIPCVPWVGDVPSGTGEDEKLVDPAVGVAAGDACHVSDIGGIHTDQIIIICIVLRSHLYRAVGHRRDPDLAQLADSAVVGRIADLLPAGGGRVDVE